MRINDIPAVNEAFGFDNPRPNTGRSRIYWHLIRPSTLPGIDHFSAMLTGTGPKIDHIIRPAYGLLIMLDDDQGIPQIAQGMQGGSKDGHCPFDANRYWVHPKHR